MYQDLTRIHRFVPDSVLKVGNRNPLVKSRAGSAHRLSGRLIFRTLSETAGWCVMCREAGTGGKHKGRQKNVQG